MEQVLSEKLIIAEVSFEQAVKNFKEFLAQNNLLIDIVWIFLEDTFSRNSKFYETNFWLKFPIPKDNEELAKKYYIIGKKEKLCIGMYAFALCENKVCCNLILLEEDSEFLLMSPKYLKFSFLKDLPKVQPIKNQLQWNLFKLFPFKYKQGCFVGYMQSKKDFAAFNQ